MKKKRYDITNRVYQMGSSPQQTQIQNSIKINEIEMIQNNRDKNKQHKIYLKKLILPKPQIPFKIQHKIYSKDKDNKIDLNGSIKYKAYLQGYCVKKTKNNRKYNIRNGKQYREGKYMKNIQQYQVKKSGATTARNIRNQSPIDSIKIKKNKVKSSNKISGNSEEKPYGTITHINYDFQSSKNLYKQGKFKQALAIADQCLEKQQNNKEFQYYTAIIQLNLHNYQRGLRLLENVCKKNPQYKKTSFLFAAISAKHLNNLDKAYKICSLGLQRYPNYKDLLLYRANINTLLHKYDQANLDFQKVLKVDNKNVQIMIKCAQCRCKMGAYLSSLTQLTEALHLDKGQHRQQILIKRIQIYLLPQINNIKQAKKDLNKLISTQKSSGQINYVKGLVLQAEGNQKQSILSFEQCLKQGSTKQIMNKALIQITKNKINDRDFYSAFYQINRSKHYQLHGEQIQIYKLFTQGVVYLMKRKIVQGDKNFQYILEKYPKLTPYIMQIFYLYRAFAKFSLSAYKQSIQCYEMANRLRYLDIFAKFNKQLAQGIIQINNKNYQKALGFFDGAEKTILPAQLNKIDSYLYRAITHILKAKSIMYSVDRVEEIGSLEEIFEGLKELDRALEINDSHSNLFYFRGLVELYLGKYDQALQDVIRAISKSQENVPKHFFFRGMIYASLGNYKQALNDYNICGNLDDKFYWLYFQRSKIHFINENITKGLQDLMKLKNIKQNQDIKYHQTCLNYYYGDYVMANVCAQQIEDQQKSRQIKILIKMKMGKIKDVKKLLTNVGDLMIIEILQGKIDIIEVPANNLQFFKIYHYHHYLAVYYFRIHQYQKALNSFVIAIKQRNLYQLQQGIINKTLYQTAFNQQQDDGNQQDDDQDQQNDKDTINRINFNIFLCYLQLKNYQKAYQVFVRDVVGAKQIFMKNQFVSVFTHLLFQSVGEDTCVNYQEKQMYQLSFYDSKLERVLPEIVIEVPNFMMKTRLCLLGLTNQKLEKIYRTKANPDFILSYMGLSEIQNRPEPPWVKRQQSGLIFTDEVQHINIQFLTTQNNQQQKDQQNIQFKGQQEQSRGRVEYFDKNDQNDDDLDQIERIRGSEKISKRLFKDKIKLNDQIQRKLQKIIQMKKDGKNNDNK